MPPRYRNDERDPTGTAPPCGSGPRAPVCETCTRPLTRWTTVLGAARCSACTPARPVRPDREPVSLGEALIGAFDEVARSVRSAPLVPAQRTGVSAAGSAAPPAAVTTAPCRRCGAAATRHPTAGGTWILLEPGDWPAGAVPADHRWRVTGDGTAVLVRGGEPAGSCRISHLDTCAARPAPYGSPVLLGLWHRNGRRTP